MTRICPAVLSESDLSALALDHIAVGVFTVDTKFRITSFNDQARALTGFTKREALGMRCYEIFRADSCFSGCPLKEAIRTEQQVIRRRMRILDKANQEFPVEITAAVLRDEDGNVIGGVESFQDDRERSQLEKKIHGTYALGDIVGKSASMATLFELLPVLAGANVSVLVLGETGTGKGLVARIIHNLSKRKDGPFVKVNCAAIPDNLLESELFGYKKGAFTDAYRDKPGHFLTADKGSIFLDEIGEMPLPVQSKLLQVIEDQEFYPLGGTRPVRSDTRIIAATNCDIETKAAEGLFRPDLFYRLNVAAVRLPTLRERREDIPLLIQHFLHNADSDQGLNITGVSKEAMSLLMRYDYPGNVRELLNILEYATVLRSRGEIRSSDLPPAVTRSRIPSTSPGEKPPLVSRQFLDPIQLEERERISEVLKTCGWSRNEAARKLGMGRTTLWRRMKQLGMDVSPRG